MRSYVAALAALVFVLFPATAAQAHRQVRPTVHHDGAGSVWLRLAWEDGHPVAEPGLAMFSGRSDTGEVLGPTAMRSLPHDLATLTLPVTLQAGRWQVTVDIATPGVGYCQTVLMVAAKAPAQAVDCAPPPTTAIALPPPQTRALWPILIALVLGCAALIAVLLLARARPGRTGRGRR
ncbi:hypothetical protein Rhe02_13830 [Rhizocola hellebori]|uniref:CopC domain-containing protein n=1 Tax=Rhizocola hellebori TaxID=1392758 RepID=A0A8J3Q436_9ACTN|nr:hypothetical protein [Rhizocola hellebori]GIH03316.1 hypothetical protein Rhe02_13830 [Rhizocola hellebori]